MDIIANMLNYKIDGHGPPLLLVHGFGISFEIWTDLAPRLREHFTLVTIELPGIGLSPEPPPDAPYLGACTDALEAARIALGYSSWRVLAYSTGTRVLERYAQLFPQAVERVAFICPLQVAPQHRVNLRFAGALDARFPRFGDWMLSGARLRFLVRLLAFNLKHHPLALDWYRFISMQSIAMLKRMLHVVFGIGVDPFALSDNIPALFLWAAQDWIVPAPRKITAHDRIVRGNHSAPQTGAQEIGDLLIPFLLRK